MKKGFLGLTAIVMACTMLTSCGSKGYENYAAAYNKVTANGGLHAKFDLSLEMDGEKKETEGTFKLDTSSGKSILLYEMTVDGNDVLQFSDGDYIYTNVDNQKSKFAIDSKPSADSESKEGSAKDDNSDGSFETSAFLSEFSSVLEAGKIKELGLLSPIEKAAIKDIKEENGVYTFTFSEEMVKNYLNIMVEKETGKSASDTVNINELNDFVYKATVKDGIITDTEYSGILKMNVPGRLLTSGEDTTYDIDLDIKITFVDPGNAVTVELPEDKDDYREIK